MYSSLKFCNLVTSLTWGHLSLVSLAIIDKGHPGHKQPGSPSTLIVFSFSLSFSFSDALGLLAPCWPCSTPRLPAHKPTRRAMAGKMVGSGCAGLVGHVVWSVLFLAWLLVAVAVQLVTVRVSLVCFRHNDTSNPPFCVWCDIPNVVLYVQSVFRWCHDRGVQDAARACGWAQVAW